MTSRRDFLFQTTVLSTALFTDSPGLFRSRKNVGLQLYTLRNEIKIDARGTIAKAAQLGYKEVESFDYKDGQYFGMTAVEFTAFLKDNGLSHPSAHYGLAILNSGWEKAIEDAKITGQKYMVLPYLKENERKTLDDYKRIAAQMNHAGQLCKSAGIQFAYHNHDFEFKELDGGHGFDILLKETDPKLVKFELDLYWASFAGQQPIEMFKQSPGRYPLWHVKDMDKTAKRYFTEVGNGSIDFNSIFANAKKAGMTHFFVEQDDCKPGTPLDSIEKSIRYIQSSLLK